MNWRNEFMIPRHNDGSEQVYFCGNSLGLQPKGAKARVNERLVQWEKLGVEGWFDGKECWYAAGPRLREPLAKIVGAHELEVNLMHTLSCNLHLMLSSFYRPTKQRYKILIDAPTFPSDLYALHSHLERCGHSPEQALISLGSETDLLSLDEIAEVIEGQGQEIALILLSGVNFYSGQYFDIPAITKLGHLQGCIVGYDLAHAVGNVPLQLHDWDVDFAVWCHYKYLCGGPGAVGGCFVHKRHWEQKALSRLAGWWGNDPEQRFQMQLLDRFHPQPGAAGWQLSAPHFLSMAPLEASLPLIAEIGMAQLRRRSVELSARLEQGLQAIGVEIITPGDPEKRGCQLSIRIDDAERIRYRLRDVGVICDFRPPSVLRLAPKPLYNSDADVDLFVERLEACMAVDTCR